MINNTNQAAALVAALRCVRQQYTPPRLSLLGDVGSLTESGSMVSMEDFLQNNMCFLPNMAGNMC
jgi:hypothetical protein